MNWTDSVNTFSGAAFLRKLAEVTQNLIELSFYRIIY